MSQLLHCGIAYRGLSLVGEGQPPVGGGSRDSGGGGDGLGRGGDPALDIQRSRQEQAGKKQQQSIAEQTAHEKTSCQQ